MQARVVALARWPLVALALCLAVPSYAQEKLTEKEAVEIAAEAYIYGYSLITTEVTRVQMTNVAKADGTHAPMGQFLNMKRYPPGDYRGVSAPNADTLYSIVWMDLGKEPMVFSHPDMAKRYYLLPMYSLWMPVIHSPGSRTTGEKAATYLITRSDWTGKVPEGMTQIKCPTRYMLILGRVYADGTDEDYKIVHGVQAKLSLVPLSAYGKPFTYEAPAVDPNPGFSMTDKPQDVILGMSVSEYFNRMAKLMGSDAPPAAEDAPILAKMAKIGVVPGQPFDITKLDPAVQKSITDLPKTTLAKIVAQAAGQSKLVNGWKIGGLITGHYGTNYFARSLIAAIGWPANLSEDAVYPTTFVDADGNKLNGANKYTLTFPKGQTPPVNGFWSITMYFDDGGWWFYPNPLNKFTVSMRDNPKFNDDGSLTLYFQNESPGTDKQANWLPAPKGEFLLTLRMYWSKERSPTILPLGRGDWDPPAVRKAMN
jgi:hypothetical protein